MLEDNFGVELEQTLRKNEENNNLVGAQNHTKYLNSSHTFDEVKRQRKHWEKSITIHIWVMCGEAAAWLDRVDGSNACEYVWR